MCDVSQLTKLDVAQLSKLDGLRSPRVSSLLALYAVDAGERADPRITSALHKYVAFVAASGKGAYGVEDVLITSGFVGLALLEMLAFGVTFGPAAFP